MLTSLVIRKACTVENKVYIAVQLNIHILNHDIKECNPAQNYIVAHSYTVEEIFSQ